MFKDTLQAYAHLLKNLLAVSRVILFDKFTAVFFFFYLLFALSLAFILSVLHWSAAVIVLFLAVVLFSALLRNFQFLKRALVRKGDRIEFADPQASDEKEMFKTATVLLKMRFDEVKKSKLISEELMEGSRYFYLVEIDKKPIVISYDWIIGLSPDILD